MSRLHLPAITAALSLIISCTVAPTTTPIENIINPEDIVAIPNSHWAIVSSIPGGSHTSGSIIAVNAITAEKYTLYPKTQKNSPIAGDCNGEVAARQFAPHGIALSSNSNGEQLLQVVNHGGREAIEHFKVTLSEIPELQWLGCTTLPAGALANAVAAFPSGELYVSNMHKLSETLSAEIFNTVGEVLHWSVKTGWQSIANSR